MSRIGTLFFAEDVRDEGNGRHMAVGLYAGIVEFSSKKSAKLPSAVVFISIDGLDAGEHSFSIAVRNVSKSKKLDIGGDEFSVDEDNTNYIVVAKLEGMFFPEDGDYEIVVSVDGDEKGIVEFEVKFINEGGDEASELA